MKTGTTLALCVFTLLAVSAIAVTDDCQGATTKTVVDGMGFELADDFTAKLVSYRLHGDMVIPDYVSYEGSDYLVEVVDINIPDDTITSLYIPGTVKEICMQSFMNCSNLGTLVLNEGLEEIDAGAFAFTSIKKLSLPSTVRWIDNGAFAGTNIAEVEIPAKVHGLHAGAFVGCPLRSISVDEGNAYYKAVDGTVYSKDGKTLLFHVSGVSDLIVPEGVVTIEGTAFDGDAAIRSVALPSTLKVIKAGAFSGCRFLQSVAIPEGVTVIGSGTFGSCISLASVSLPDSLETVGADAFTGCVSLTEVSFGSRLSSYFSSFSQCPNISKISVSEDNEDYAVYDNVLFNKDGTKLVWYPAGKADEIYVVPMGTKEIGAYAFELTTYLKEPILPFTVERIGNHAFSKSSLERITIPAGVEELPMFAFIDCRSLEEVVIPENVTSIEEGCFCRCTSLESAAVPSSVTMMQPGAFSGCTSLKDVVFLADIDKIPSGTFSGCTSLESFAMPDSVVGMEDSAFYGCSSLEALDLGYAMLAADHFATPFYGCSSLKTITVAAGNPCMEVVDGVLFNAELGMLVLYPAGDVRTSYTVPAGTESIAKEAFVYASKLESLTLPDTLVDIGGNAFSYCYGLTEVVFGKNVTVVDDCAWLGCTSLRTLVVPEDNQHLILADGVLIQEDGGIARLLLYPAALDGKAYTIPSDIVEVAGGAFAMSMLEKVDGGENVESYQNMAFYRCTQLKEVALSPKAVAIGNNCFDGCTSLVSVDLPEGMKYVFGQAFLGCKSVKTLSLSPSTVFIDSSALALGVDTATGEVNPVKVSLLTAGVVIPAKQLAYGGYMAVEIDYSVAGHSLLYDALIIMIIILMALAAAFVQGRKKKAE